MSNSTATWRTVEEQVVRGRQRLIFVRERDRWVLTTLSVYADGVVAWSWQQTDFAGLRAAFDDGTLTLAPPADAQITVAGAATGPARLESRLTPELVIADLADEWDRLNDRPDSSGRCRDALTAYAAEPTPANLEIVPASGTTRCPHTGGSTCSATWTSTMCRCGSCSPPRASRSRPGVRTARSP